MRGRCVPNEVMWDKFENILTHFNMVYGSLSPLEYGTDKHI